MPDTAISRFFDEKKEAWLKQKLKASMDDSRQREVHQECSKRFSYEVWLPDAARRAKQLSLVTHPCTFSHPSAKKNKNGESTPIVADAQRQEDGFLKSGNVHAPQDVLGCAAVNLEILANVHAPQDVLGNAAALDVYKFLTLNLEDNRTLLTHIQEDSAIAKALLTIDTASYDALKDGFMAILKTDTKEVITSSKIKQVFFPVDSDYHLLSILTPSGLMFEMRRRLDHMRFNDDVKLAREKRRNNTFCEQAFQEIYNLTTIGFGGSNTQNISVLNSHNKGKAHLLLCAPPRLNKRDIPFPKRSFFQQSITPWDCRDDFQGLHRVYMIGKNNRQIRAARDAFYVSILDNIVQRMWQIRAVSDEYFNPKYHLISASEQIWLLSSRVSDRDASGVWLDDIVKAISHFIFKGYERVLGRKSKKLGDDEKQHITGRIHEHREVLL